MDLKKRETKKEKIFLVSNAYLLVFVVCTTLVVVITFFLQNYTTTLLRHRLDERLIAITSTASLQFSGDEIEALHKMGNESYKSDLYKKNVLKLQEIRAANKNILYAYIVTKTNDPNTVVFVADADAMVIEPTIDFNEDGEVNSDDISKPGDLYDVSEYPAMREEGFVRPSVEKELGSDTFGTFLTAYAPIYNGKREVVAELAIDVEVSDFKRLVNATFIPFVLFVVALIFLITFLTTFLIRIWRNRVKIVQELDRQKDELLGIVAHQLAKPITAIRWDLESLLDGDLGALNNEQKTEAESMRTQAIGLADLVSMILDVSRIQLGRIQLDPRPLDLNELFKEMLEVIKPTIAQKKINFVKKMPETLPTVYLDKRYTRMTIENLLTNAVKYTPEGGKVTLDIVLEKGVMNCRVSDTGCGIPKADQGKIFGKMYRASNVVNTVEGNGFGLYVAKGAVEGQGGTIGFESTEGKGTTFFFTLPMKEAVKEEVVGP